VTATIRNTATGITTNLVANEDGIYRASNLLAGDYEITASAPNFNSLLQKGVTLTVGAGTIVEIYSGTGTAGSAAEIVLNGTLQVDGTESSPVVFAPDVAGRFWGGIEMPAATSGPSCSI